MIPHKDYDDPLDVTFIQAVTVAPEYEHLSRVELAKEHPGVVLAMKARMFDLMYEQCIQGTLFDKACDDVQMDSLKPWSYARNETFLKDLTAIALIEKQSRYLWCSAAIESMDISSHSTITFGSKKQILDLQKSNEEIGNNIAKYPSIVLSQTILVSHYFMVKKATNECLDLLKRVVTNVHESDAFHKVLVYNMQKNTVYFAL